MLAIARPAGDHAPWPSVALLILCGAVAAGPTVAAAVSTASTANREVAAEDRPPVPPDSFKKMDASGAPGQPVTKSSGDAKAAKPEAPSPQAPGAIAAPLLPQHAVDLELVFVPPRAPDGSPWEVHLGRNPRQGEGMSEPREKDLTDGVPSALGVVRVPQVRPGRFYLIVDNAGYWRDDLMVHGAADARIEVRLEGVEVEGTVTLGEAPGADVGLLFEPQAGFAYSYLKTGPDGHFRGRLRSGPGRWTIQATLGRQDLPITLWRELREDRPGHATLDLRLPRTRLFGRVIDEKGDPYDRADLRVDVPGLRTQIFSTEFGIDLYRGPAMAMVQLDAKGGFDLRGLPTGPLQVRAWTSGSDGTPRRHSGRLELQMEDGEEAGPITLRLRPMLHLPVRVVQGGKPIPRLEVWAYGPDDFIDLQTSGEKGELDFEIPVDVERVVLVARGGLSALRARAVPAAGGPVRLDLEPEGGRLALTLPSSLERLQGAGRALEVEQDGVWLPNTELQVWRDETGSDADSTPERLALYAMAAGHYRACLGPLGLNQRIDRRESAGGGLHCVEGDLAVDEELELDLVE